MYSIHKTKARLKIVCRRKMQIATMHKLKGINMRKLQIITRRGKNSIRQIYGGKLVLGSFLSKYLHFEG
jgi:hypothetical protein